MKPTKVENQDVWEHELKLRLEKQAAAQNALSEAEKKRLKELHWMQCPKCGHKLTTEKCGTVEIDVCPSCKGLWLDVNELDRIVDGRIKNRFLRSLLKALGGA